MDACDAIWCGIGIPAAVAIGYGIHAIFKNRFQEPASTLLKFTPEGMSCIRCLNELKSVCSKPDCAFSKYDYVCSLIRGAEKKIDFCVPLCSMRERHLPVIEARKRNIPVRVMLDSEISREGIGGKKSIQCMEDAGCSVRFGKQSRLMHHKFILVDDKILILCTQSWTVGGYFCNFENIEITYSKDAVKAFSDEFEYLYQWEEKLF